MERARPLSTTAVREAVTAVETDFPVETWTLDRVRVWPLLRIDLYYALFYAGRTPPAPVQRSRRRELLSMLRRQSKQLLEFGKAVVLDRRSNARVPAGCGCVFLTYTQHRTFFGDSWYDKFCDPYVHALSSLGISALLLEISQDGTYLLPRHGRSKLIQPGLLKAEFMVWRHPRSTRVEMEGVAEMLACVRRAHPEISLPSIEGLIQKWQLVLRLKDYFSRILDRARPAVVFLAEYYSPHGAAMILAARERGILTVDIQHGVQGDEHLAYGSWRKVPTDGYELLPSVFWCWSDYETETIRKWNGPVRAQHDTFVGGSLWAALWRDSQHPLVREYDARVRALASRSGERCDVLFTPSMPGDVKEWIFEAISRSAAEFYWWIRLHPSRRADFGVVDALIRRYGLTNVNVKVATALPLQALLRHVKANITAFSSTVVDAEQVGVPSVLIDPAGVGLFPRQLASGTATCAFESEALLHALRGRAGRRRTESSQPGESGAEKVRKFLAVHAPQLLG